jgi:hypothetical protein
LTLGPIRPQADAAHADAAQVTMLELSEVREGSQIYVMPGALSASSCAEIIRRFEAQHDAHQRGRIGQQAILDETIKRSTDLTISGPADWLDVDRRLFQSLRGALGALQAQVSFFRGRFKDMGYAIQRTEPGEFYHWHVDGGSHDFADRQLVAIWYLNDVASPGGETEFSHQNVKVRAQCGKLLLFPPFWTHEHRGVTVETGVKYIATTWVAFA